ncbi:MAG: hypothetical protein AUG04_07750 [Deltaproteobacteria bacterium 13_1_20CM_2_69_21]|nr:MAG: hypothetical protein AUH83_03140 [Deltaproteobacteria bacterium 13_1_40CM_4_68_19]OLE62905.1 MAG: hypothetical protein AUG04_07750 [Deltaproteobacteria bacterium 13_1_20CM_2_69_21]
MMSRVPAIFLISVAACGSGSVPPLFGGFTPTNGAAVILAPATCNNIPFVGPTAISGILVELTSGADACHVLTLAKQCGSGSGSTTLLAGALSGVVGGSTVAPAGPGTYPWLANPPTGTFLASTTTAAQVDANCTSAPGSPTHMSGGSIAVSTVTSSAVSGSMDVHFDNGQAYKNAFDVPVCPVSIDICSLFDFCGSHSCVQP